MVIEHGELVKMVQKLCPKHIVESNIWCDVVERIDTPGHLNEFIKEKPP